MIILGAGMAGCLAGIVNRDVTILERASGPTANHHALIRFRTDAISKVTGIPFKQVHVQKSIWDGKKDIQPSVSICNMYSRKVTGHYIDRSINDISPVTRYVAPADFHEQMLRMLAGRIEYDSVVTDISEWNVKTENKVFGRVPSDSVISTLPMGMNSRIADVKLPFDSVLDAHTIFITKFEIEKCDKYATVYYPQPGFPVYRASLAGNELIIESISEIGEDDIYLVFDSLGMDVCDHEQMFGNIPQQNGKIIPMSERDRKAFLFQLTQQRGVYSLGRFATWRNILLDDVLNDIYVIKRMITTDSYDLARGSK